VSHRGGWREGQVSGQARWSLVMVLDSASLYCRTGATIGF
jgi:hypothetical protein